MTDRAIEIGRSFAEAENAFQLGRFAEAERLLAALRPVAASAPVHHLSALAARRLNRNDSAEGHFLAALEYEPNNPQILTNFGNLLAERGRIEEAFAQYGRAEASDARFQPLFLSRGSLFRRLGRHRQALADFERAASLLPEDAQAHSLVGFERMAAGDIRGAAEGFDRALANDPNRISALAGRASAAMQLGDSDAPALLRRALALKPGDGQLIIQLAEALEQEGDPEGIRIMDTAVGSAPDWLQGQTTLARIRWEAGERDGFTSAIEKRLSQTPRNRGLWEALIVALATADRHEQAAVAARRAQATVGEHPGLAMFEALESSEAGDLPGADRAFARVPADFPGIHISEARHRLRAGQIDRAGELLTAALDEDPWDVTAWALRGIVWRLTGDSRNAWLHEQPGFVAAHELPLTDEEIASVAETLRSLHRTRAHPLGQSLRGGTQTRGRLLERVEPPIRLLREAIEEVLQRHWDGLPGEDDSHPLLRLRAAPPRIEGSWSVRLSGDGYHVSHIHPHGTLSSACYFVVPEEQEPGDGHLEIGGAPPELGLGLGPLSTFRPWPGRIVLFPSTMYHGTRPFPRGERLTAAFDVVPA